MSHSLETHDRAVLYLLRTYGTPFSRGQFVFYQAFVPTGHGYT
ncbi:MAG: hypothetical protein PHQ33_04185 [Bacteroidales bacterium]|nr:hypothetical protein [Bacteroidales bacterium]